MVNDFPLPGHLLELFELCKKCLLRAGTRAAGGRTSCCEASDGRNRQENVVFNKACLHNLFAGRSGVSAVCRLTLAIQRATLKAMMAQDRVPSHTALWLLAYTWLLRLPSEALPMCVCASEPQRGAHKAAIWRDGDEVCILLSSRKNLQGGSGVLRRACCCQGNAQMCPVHILWDKFLASVPVGTMPWLNVSPAQVLKWIRGALLALAVCIVFLQKAACAISCKQVPNASAYGTHSFRRGHARVCGIWIIHCAQHGVPHVLAGPSGVRSNASRDSSCWSMEKRGLHAVS